MGRKELELEVVASRPVGEEKLVSGSSFGPVNENNH